MIITFDYNDTKLAREVAEKIVGRQFPDSDPSSIILGNLGHDLSPHIKAIAVKNRANEEWFAAYIDLKRGRVLTSPTFVLNICSRESADENIGYLTRCPQS